MVISASENIVTRFAINNEASFLAGIIGPVRTDNNIPALIYDDNALRPNPSRLGITGIWSREFDLSGLIPYKITSIGYSMTIPPGASVQAELFRGNKYDSNGDELTTPFNPSPPSIYDKTFSTTQMHGLGSIETDGNYINNETDIISPVNGQGLTTQELYKLRLTQGVNPVAGPEVRGIIVTTQGTYPTDYKYYSRINYSITPALPEGVSIISADGTRIEPIENEMEKFDFGYNRVGGNDTFTLNMRWDWDHELPLDYDDRIVYVRNGEVWYRGIIDSIRPKLTPKESIIITGAGAAKQMNHVIVNMRFSYDSIHTILITLLDKYLSGPESPPITYDLDDIQVINETIDGELDFKNKTLFEAITELANIAGANPTNRGNTGNDIIWGVDQNFRFYFKRKSTDYRFPFIVGKNISVDDSRIAPQFNAVTFVGNSDGLILQNFIPDGSCNGTEGSIDADFHDIWLLSNNLTVEATQEIDDVKFGRQAYKLLLNHDDVSDINKSFRTHANQIIQGTRHTLSFYAKTRGNSDVPLIVTIRTFSSHPGEPPNITVIQGPVRIVDGTPVDTTTDQHQSTTIGGRIIEENKVTNINTLNYRAHSRITQHITAFPLTPEFRKYSISFDPVTSTDEIAYIIVSFTVDREEDALISDLYDEEYIIFDGIYLHQEFDNPEDQLRGTRTQDEHKYNWEVFASDGEYNIYIEDETEIERFGRRKEAVREIDTIRDFNLAYQFGRSLLGGNTTETRRCKLSITTTEESYEPYTIASESINWGHARVLGSDTESTHYAYSVIRVAHTLRDEQINTKIELGSPRPDVSQVLSTTDFSILSTPILAGPEGPIGPLQATSLLNWTNKLDNIRRRSTRIRKPFRPTPRHTQTPSRRHTRSIL